MQINAEKTVHALFTIVKEERQPILGLQACEKLGLIKRVHVIGREAVQLAMSQGAALSCTMRSQQSSQKCLKA